jgi:hypothetical protein
MTTTARPAEGQPRGRTSQVLLVAGLCVAGAVALATLVAGLGGGRTEALGALAGGSIALGFFLFGSLVIEMATRMVPQLAMLMALLTYILQVALVALVFVVLTSSGAVGTTLSGGWLAGGVIVATMAWTAGQLVGSAKARIPAYDIDLPDQSKATADDISGVPSQAREVGAP